MKNNFANFFNSQIKNIVEFKISLKNILISLQYLKNRF